MLWGIPDLSTDYLDLGRELGRAAGALLDRHALLAAIETGAAARTRLSLARDVHDSIVQFLAGAAFRIEAIKRAAKSGAAVETDLDELKRLLVEEQGELRGFVTALRRDPSSSLAKPSPSCARWPSVSSQQWSVDCRISANGETAAIPIRLQLDLQQLLTGSGGECRSPRRRRRTSKLALRSMKADCNSASPTTDADFQMQRGVRSRALVAQGTRRARATARYACVRARVNQYPHLFAPCRSCSVTKVLLVDDHPMIGAALEMLLRRYRLPAPGTCPQRGRSRKRDLHTQT